MVLRKTRDKLTEVMDQRAQDRSNVMGGLGKTQIDKDVKLGKKAYSGEFSGPGVIDAIYQDHGTGRNLFDYDEVNLAGYPVGQWYVGGVAAADRFLYSLENDPGSLPRLGKMNVIQQTSSAAANTYGTYQTFFGYHINYAKQQDYVYSSFVYMANGCKVQVRARGYASISDASSNTNPIDLGSGPEITKEDGEIEFVRAYVAFNIPSTVNAVRFEHRILSPSAPPAEAYWYGFMFERVDAGQTKPSKFTLPMPVRGDLSPNLLSADSTPWIAPTLLNSWVNHGAPYANVGYYKDPLGWVYIRGTIKNGTSGTNAFNLPSGYRPSADLGYVGALGSAANICRILVHAGGNVEIANAPTVSEVHLDNIRFRV